MRKTNFRENQIEQTENNSPTVAKNNYLQQYFLSRGHVKRSYDFQKYYFSFFFNIFFPPPVLSNWDFLLFFL